ncbi:DUF4959 domain-containing protein [Parapedobacter sp. 10938]|uniref:DUF4959 domain-containing protein n=1 Tax=Parapedobacter flavus TaxID=3110225 RepID=UPI002DB8D48F|nr:DUF4959 domain-containing protein [Parapedobacter sp. 10938]MEC3880509.1 DUF4959 domain-containing protein [Parapedobacter sp. 10938]
MFKSTILKALTLITIALSLCYSCKESGRFEIGYEDGVPPQTPEYLRYKPTYGGARIYFKRPADEDLLSIDASYVNEAGKKMWFSTSFISDYIDVYGFATQNPTTIALYAVDRAGNQSDKISIVVEPLEPAVEQVASTIYCVAGFSSFYVNWENGLKQSINVFVDYTVEDENGVQTENHLIYTSREATERRFIRDPNFSSVKPVSVSVYVEDEFGNSSERLELGQLNLLEDWEIPKEAWQIPGANDSTIVNAIGERINTGVPMGFFNALEGRDYMAIDGIISDGTSVNFTHTYGWGRTGDPRDGNMPWNYIIDLGDYYELSRIVTHQRYRHTGATEYSGREDYYRNENVGKFAVWRWDDQTQKWDSITTHKITFPIDLPDRQYRVLGRQGDMAYMAPENPSFTKPTRWFRYEALTGFNDNYEALNANCLSEITLYGRKAEGYSATKND